MKLVQRICKCGCNKTFKCLETSGQRYLSKLHIYADLYKGSNSKEAKRRRGTTAHEEWEYKRITQPRSSSIKQDDETSQLENTLIQ